MKIGIVSMHEVRNYGSFLQAYALKRLLEQQGHSVKFIDIQKKPSPESETFLKVALAKLRLLDRYMRKRLAFQKKRQQLRRLFPEVQEKYLGLGETRSTTNDCDAIVIGSDEIFNCDSQGHWEITPERFGFHPTAKRTISYAASCGYAGVADISDADRAVIAKGLACLDTVSVRDENTAKFVQAFGQREVLYHLDPVLIYEFNEELGIAPICQTPAAPYMVVYAYHNRIRSKEEINAIRSYAKKHGLKTVAIGGVQAWCDDYAAIEPFAVLEYFRNAACIVTDTFHGTVMSAKFNKPFAVIVRDSNANKLEDLLTRLQLEERRVRDMGKLTAILDSAPDYSAFNQIIFREKTRTGEYLTSALLD